MSTPSHQSITQHFAALPDPRLGHAKRHLLLDILVIAICALLCGADTWVEIELWGHANQKWLETFLALPNGIPSHDTFGRVFARLDPKRFERCFLQWVRAVSKLTQRQVVAIDGKKLRRSHDRTCGQKAITRVSAWATANQLVLGQVKVKPRSNERTALPELLRILELTGCIVTLDAMGSYPKVASQIVARGADYLLAVKENQGQLYEDLRDLFTGYLEANFDRVPHGYCKTVDKHGRLEIRECWTVSDPDSLEFVRRRGNWPHLRTLVMVRAERQSPRDLTGWKPSGAWRRASSLPACRTTPSCYCGWCAGIGASRTGCIGCSTLISGRMKAGCARTTAQKTSQSCATLRLTY